jgi:hypothetical protein
MALDKPRQPVRKKQTKAEAMHPGGMQVEVPTTHPWVLQWDRVKTVEDLMFIMRLIMTAQFGTDEVRMNNELAQSLNEKELAVFERIFAHV